MELFELQNLWLENNQKLEQTLQINKVMLSQLLKAKPEKRLILIQTEAIITLMLPLVILALFGSGIFELTINRTDNFQFYLGIVLFGSAFISNYILTTKYYALLLRIDFSQNMLEIKTRILKAEAFKLKLTRISYLMMPFAIIGIFLLMGMPVFKMDPSLPIVSYLPLLLIVLVFIGSLVVTFKYTLVQRFKKLKTEIAEIEKLMSDHE